MGASHDDLTRHAALLAGLARGLMGPGADADDLQQEVWLAALQGGAAVSRPHGWLATVARRLAARERLSEARRRERERHVARAEQQPAPQELVAELEIAQRLTAAVRRLAEPLRSTLHQHYAEGLTAAEIAERTRVPVETVRSRIQRGLELLRRDLARELGDDARAWRAAFAPLLALTTARRGGLMATTWKLVGAGALALAALTIAWKNVETERAAPRGLERTEAWSAELARASRSDGELRPPPAAPERAAPPPPVGAPALEHGARVAERAPDPPASTTAVAPPTPQPVVELPAYVVPPLPEPSGTLVGRVTLAEGEPTELAPLKISADQCKPLDLSLLDLIDPTLLVGAERGLRDVVVQVEVPDARVTVPDEPFVVTSERWRFEPHVTLLPIGSRVQFHNADPGSIHVHTFAQKNGEFHRTLGAGTSSVDYALKSPEAVFVKDDIHPWTSATLFATDTPFAARTDAEGKFAIAGLPPGEYTVTVWHELLGTARESARIVVDQSTALDFVLRPRKGRLDGRRRVDGTR